MAGQEKSSIAWHNVIVNIISRTAVGAFESTSGDATLTLIATTFRAAFAAFRFRLEAL